MYGIRYLRVFDYVSVSYYSALMGRPGRVKFILDDLRWKKTQRTYHSYTTTAWRLSALRCNEHDRY